jgi:hypothetical protein
MATDAPCEISLPNWALSPVMGAPIPILIVEPGLMIAQPNLSVPHLVDAAGWQAIRIILATISKDIRLKTRLNISSSPFSLDRLNRVITFSRFMLDVLV